MSRACQVREHGFDEVFACAVEAGAYAGCTVEGVEDAAEGYKWGWFGWRGEEFGVCDYGGNVAGIIGFGGCG